MTVPEDLDWWLFRPLTDPRCSVTWTDLHRMSLLDLLDLHRSLDLRDELEAKAARAARPKD